jgi:hypothetical protein
MENEMQVDVTSYESIIAVLALILITVFSLAAFSDRHWRNAGSLRDFRIDQNRNIRPGRDDSDDKDMTSNLYLRYADLSALSLGTAEKQIRVHGQKRQNVEDD